MFHVQWLRAKVTKFVNTNVLFLCCQGKSSRYLMEVEERKVPWHDDEVEVTGLVYLESSLELSTVLSSRLVTNRMWLWKL